MSATDLAAVARAMVAPGRGILAADESNATATKRFDAIGIDSTPDSRRQYRQTLFATPGIEEYISGVIMYDETIRQSTDDGTPFPKLLESRGVLPGIKVDTGAKPLAFSPDEKVTEGLDGLRERIKEYVEMGAKFAKWRAVITPGPGMPTDDCIHVNAHALARYAALCQEGGLVPIVEPEVLMDGDNDIDGCYDITVRTHREVFAQLALQRVDFEGMILKPNMVVAGKKSGQTSSAQEVAEKTLACLYRTVPPAVPGIAFLSGGMTAEEAMERLDAMNKMGPHPWQLSFSYGRALQDEALKTWKGAQDNVAEAQKVFTHRSQLTSAARGGTYSREMETAGV
jgi:fructose-bisphosphate aldolase class I